MKRRKLMVNGAGIQVEDHGGTGDAAIFIHYG